MKLQKGGKKKTSLLQAATKFRLPPLRQLTGVLNGAFRKNTTSICKHAPAETGHSHTASTAAASSSSSSVFYECELNKLLSFIHAASVLDKTASPAGAAYIHLN